MRKQRYAPAVVRFWRNVCVDDGCWLWTGTTDTGGYGVISVDGKHVKTHRFSYRLHFHAEPGDLCVCHTCDTPNCVKPGHLFLGTPLDNARDRERKGRGHDKRGEKNPRAKLTEADVRRIRARWAAGETQAAIGADYGLVQAYVSQITRRLIWREVT